MSSAGTAHTAAVFDSVDWGGPAGGIPHGMLTVNEKARQPGVKPGAACPSSQVNPIGNEATLSTPFGRAGFAAAT